MFNFVNHFFKKKNGINFQCDFFFFEKFSTIVLYNIIIEIESK